MIPKLPSYVFINADNVSEKRVENYRRDEFETGPIRQVRTDCKSRFEISFRVQICKGNYRDFLDWFSDVIRQGTQYFQMIHPITGEKIRARFVGNELDFNYVSETLLESTFLVEYIYE